MANKVELEIKVVVDGRTWALYPVQFRSDGTAYSTYIYAISDEHAQALLTDMRETATVEGPIVYVG